ncbi:MAG TPA: fluoride efflux transporter CrcB [bacterium]|nr:fluoride efflux transporter CrcB [bacterium]
MEKLLWISLGGVLGAWSRYYVGLWAADKWGTAFATGTFLINFLGSAFMAWILTLSLEKGLFTPHLRLALTVGFCACFTTFSTFSWDTFRYLSEGNWKYALLNVGLNVGGCLIGTWSGVVLARAW